MPGGARYQFPQAAQALSCFVRCFGKPVKGHGPATRPSAQGTANLLRLRLQCATQKLQIFGDLAILRAQFLDTLHPVHHGGVVAPTKTATDFRQ